MLVERAPKPREGPVTLGEADPVDREIVHETGVEHVRGITAAAHARRRLLGHAQEEAERFHVFPQDGLVAEIEVEPLVAGRGFRVTADLDADVVQSCVVSLEPVPAHIHDHQAQLFVNAPEAGKSRTGDEIRDDTEEEAEPIVDGQIDLGEAVAQQLALALPAYPRAPAASISALTGTLPDGVSLCIEDEKSSNADGKESPSGPFAALARMKGAPAAR